MKGKPFLGTTRNQLRSKEPKRSGALATYFLASFLTRWRCARTSKVKNSTVDLLHRLKIIKEALWRSEARFILDEADII
jgi:hypothetical protein